MSRTVIDELIIKLGLDPRDFTKGEKAAAAAVTDLESKTKQSSQSMGNAVGGLAKKFLGLAAVLSVLRKGIGLLNETADTIRHLGIQSQRLGIAVNELANFGNAVQLAGGDAKTAIKSIESFQKSIYDLAFNGEMSGSLQMLGRLGVQFQDSAGRARNFEDVLLDAADSVERLQQQGTMTRPEAYQALLQAGFDEGSANLALMGRAKATQELNRQRLGQRQLDQHDVAVATEFEQTRERKEQSRVAAGAAGIESEAGSFLQKANDFGDYFYRLLSGEEKVGDALNSVKDAATGAAAGLASLATAPVRGIANSSLGRAVGAEGAWFKQHALYSGTINAAAKQYGVDPARLTGLIAQESGFDKDARSKAGAVGIAQLMPQFFPGAGKDPHADIFTAAKELRRLYDAERANDPVMSENQAWDFALQDYNGGYSRRQEAANGGRPLRQETLDYPGKVMAYAEQARSMGVGGGNTSTVNIGEVNVLTQAADAQGMADGATSALTRKLNAAQAEIGMVQ